MKEIWKDIEGYEGLYQISNMGRVKSLARRGTRGGIIKPAEIKKGYLQYALVKDGILKWYKAHRLVAQAFIPNPNNLPCVNHRDENPHNNYVENLEWCTIKYNNSYGTRIKKIINKLKRKVYQYSLDGLFIQEWESIRELERQTGFLSGSISQVCQGKRKTAYGFKWSYAA